MLKLLILISLSTTSFAKSNICEIVDGKVMHSLKIGEKVQVVYCRNPEDDYKSEFSILLVNTSVIPKIIYNSDPFLKNFKITPQQNGYHITEKLESLHLFDVSIECDQEDCDIKETCHLKKNNSTKKTTIVEQIKSKIGKENNKPPYLEALIKEAFKFALDGDKTAKEFFEKNVTGLERDAAAYESYEAAKRDITRLKKTKCW